MNKNKKLGFTLAEVLIVIGIIGVVAALTLPNLNKATGNKETITKVKKAYSTLTEALDRAQAIYGPYDTWTNDIQLPDDPDMAGGILEETKVNRLGKRVSEFMKVSKDCGRTGTGCFDSGIYKVLSGESSDDTSWDNPYYRYNIITADGMSIRFERDTIRVDIDGPNKGNNTQGKDLFYFYIVNNQLNTLNSYWLENMTFTSLLQYITYGSDAAYWILTYDNMDYTKLTDANGTCDNGNVVTESNPSCN